MIDWITLIAPWYSPPTGMVRLTNDRGDVEHEFPRRLQVPGAGGATTARVCFMPKANEILIAVNPIKFLTGQNVVGSCDVIVLGNMVLLEVASYLGVAPSKEELEAWRTGRWRLKRVDIAGYVKLPSAELKQSIIRSLRIHVAARKLGMSSPDFGYVAVRKKRRTVVAVYDKYAETDSFKKVPIGLREHTALIKRIEQSLRVEVQLFAQELRTRGLQGPVAWQGLSLSRLIAAELRVAKLCPDVRVPAMVLASLNARSRLELEAWMKGVDILRDVKRATRSRRVTKFKRLGYDVTVPCANSIDTIVISDTFSGIRISSVVSRNMLRHGCPCTSYYMSVT